MSTLSTPLDFKSATLYTLRAVLHTDDTSALLQALDQRMHEAGAFYENEPVILDASGLDAAPDWRALTAALRKHHLYPIGVQAGPALQASLQAADLAPLDAGSGRPAHGDATSAPAAAAQPATTAPAARHPEAPSPRQAADATPTHDDAKTAGQTLVIRHPLRSGQRIYAKGGDLIVMGMVSQGAEVIADGNIHVYGPLRGKAMAGAQGRTDAMILTTQLDPELLAIAGVYRVVETHLPDTLHNHAAQVLLEGGTLRIRAL
ncbi:septum site-determining protein MinC [Castellaniella caeni]|uniref:septum site-determining protein MinC n=1 Tax=Castellaniella caeni TaxID=266123 RepID=UPI000836FC71|nr:septum site-determining protein MinC [Castellaniella caeni]